MRSYNAAVLKTLCMIGMLAAAAVAQQQPQVRVNVMNVCTPEDADKSEIAAAMQRLPRGPRFTGDFEIARGRSTVSAAALQAAGAPSSTGEDAVAEWVRVRREFPSNSPFISVQYTFSLDKTSATETLVFRLREPKDVMEVTLQDSISSSGDPATVLATDTPPERIKVERFGKSSLGLSRCANTTQTQYEGLFRDAATIMQQYRKALNVRGTVADDLRRLHPPKKPAPASPKK